MQLQNGKVLFQNDQGCKTGWYGYTLIRLKLQGKLDASQCIRNVSKKCRDLSPEFKSKFNQNKFDKKNI